MSFEKILLVDDEDELLSTIENYLKPRGYTVLVAHSGREALKKAMECPDLIFLDILMPDMDGFEVLAKLRKDPDTVNTPIIMLTARTEPEFIRQSQELGANDFIAKPASLEKLLEVIKKWISMDSRNG